MIEPLVNETWHVRGPRGSRHTLVKVLDPPRMSTYGEPFCWVLVIEPKHTGPNNPRPCELRDFISRVETT